MSRLVRRSCLALAAACLAAGGFLALAHPVWPLPATWLFLGLVPVFAWRPWLGPLALPALLPLLDFAPWTGGLIVDEFDLLMLAALAGGYFGIWRKGSGPPCVGVAFRLALAAACLIGWSAAGASPQDIGGFAGYASPMNALRVGKSLLWTALLWPLLAASCEALSRRGMLTRFFWAALLGSVWVVLAIFWERAFFPGLLDIRAPYRTVGPFWEMHHGGAALDVYLALIAPLLAWAWRQTLPAVGRPFLGAFILAFVYVCLTTFSRGTVCATGGAVVLHGLLHAWRNRGQDAARAARIRPGSLLLIALAGVEAFMVFGTDSFMNARLRETALDFGGRLAHWERALGALKSPADWLFGIGLGKFPSPRIQRELGVPLPGSFEAAAFSDGTRGIRLSGPDKSLQGAMFGRFHAFSPRYALSQRIDLVPGAPHRLSMRMRGERSGLMLLRVCASHLLYPALCSGRMLRFEGGAWHERNTVLPGRAFGGGAPWLMPGHGVFLISVLTPGETIDISEIRLEAKGVDLIANPRFDAAKGRWFPQSFHYFHPWHIDNLYLELLVETGIAGLLAFLCVVLRVVFRLFKACLAKEAFAVELLSSGAGALTLGSIVSVLDMPRVATLAGSLLVLGYILAQPDSNHGERGERREP
ncbi:MAG: fungal specific transcription factor domain-containing protein [Candidatus Accumulibacter sp.]|nr:fungal specific transcription factor domain-containing protein [Accumulibacter sp.]